MEWEAISTRLSAHNRLRLHKVLPLVALTIALLMMAAGFLLLFLMPTARVALAAGIEQKQEQPVHHLTNSDELTIQIQSNVTSTVMGGTIHYTMTIANQSVMTATNVTAFTLIPTDTTYLSGTVITQFLAPISTQTLKPDGYYDPQFDAIIWVGNLAPKTTVNIRYTVKVTEESDCLNNISATANLQPAFFAPPISDTVFVELLCTTNAYLQLTHTSNVTVTTLQGVIEYQVHIRNTSFITITDLLLINMLPRADETTYLTGTLTASRGNAHYGAGLYHFISWTGDVPAQESVLITFAIQVTDFTTCKTLDSEASLQARSLFGIPSASTTVLYRCPQIRPLQLALRASITETTPGAVIDYQLLVTNTSDLPTNAFQIANNLPIGAAYVTGSATATVGAFTHRQIEKELAWVGAVPERSTATLHFQLRVYERIPCGNVITTKAYAYDTDDMKPNNPSLEATTTITCTETQAWTDFGDAPDSDSNHHGMNNTAYPETGVLGRFPTVWEGTPAGEASGPTHHIGHFWLGNGISAEIDADLNLDPQSITYGYDFTNILHNGREDVADQDEDEGWFNRNVPMLNCESATLLVRVSRSSLPTTVERLWLNVWFDGNRDGDWQDRGSCPGIANQPGTPSFEWLVQDWTIDPNQIPIGGHLALKIPTELIYNSTPTIMPWLRFTLSEQPALRPTTGGFADGRGPAYPALFQVGETEDYRMDGLPEGDPISMDLQHYIGDAMTGTVYLGGKIDFDLLLEPAQGVAPATVMMTHSLPAEITLVDQPEFYVFHKTEYEYLGPDNGVTPLAATFRPDKGPSGRIEWRGQMIQGVEIFIGYEAEVKTCPPPNESGQPMLRSVAQVRQPDGTVVNAEATYLVDCTLMSEESMQLFLPLVHK